MNTQPEDALKRFYEACAHAQAPAHAHRIQPHSLGRNVVWALAGPAAVGLMLGVLSLSERRPSRAPALSAMTIRQLRQDDAMDSVADPRRSQRVGQFRICLDTWHGPMSCQRRFSSCNA